LARAGLVWRRLSRRGESGYWGVWAWARVVRSRVRRTRIGFMDAGVFIQYIIRKAVIVFITAFLTWRLTPRPPLRKGEGEPRRHSI